MVYSYENYNTLHKHFHLDDAIKVFTLYSLITFSYYMALPYNLVHFFNSCTKDSEYANEYKKVVRLIAPPFK